MDESEAAEALAQELEALRGGDPGPIAAQFAEQPDMRTPILKALLPEPLDGPVARAFAMFWKDVLSERSEHWMDLLRWYLVVESETQFQERRQTQLDILKRVVWLPTLPATEAGIALACGAARVAVERGGRPGLRKAGSLLLRRVDLEAVPLTAAMFHAAIQAVDMSLLRRLIARWPSGPVPRDLSHALDWAVGLMIEFGEISPEMGAIVDERFRQDPQEPLVALRKVQIDMLDGKTFGQAAPPLLNIRRDPQNPDLKSTLAFGYWQAFIGDDPVNAGHFKSALQEIDPAWGQAPDPDPDPEVVGTRDYSDDVEGLVKAAHDLSRTNWNLDSPWDPETLQAGFDDIATSIARAPLPDGWGPQRLLGAAQWLFDVDRAEFVWLHHFADVRHAMGEPRFGVVNLKLLPAFHAGLMMVVGSLCRRALEAFLRDDPRIELGTAARLIRLHGRAVLRADRPDLAQRVIDRVAGFGLLPDVVAIEQDNIRLATGLGDDGPWEPPPSRSGTSLHGFLAHDAWSRAEGVTWSPFRIDPYLTGRFEVVWHDGRIERATHDTIPGAISLARVPGLRLVPEDHLIGPAGNVLRPDTYHTSAEYPWPSTVMVAAGRRAIRLRPKSWSRCDEPVLVLEAFEILRWANYFHWVVPILSRIALAKEDGLLAKRRLVVPEGLSSWMRKTLEIMGLDGEAVLTLPLGHGVTFGDATLMSSIEYVSPSGIAALRRCLMGPLAAQALAADGPALFLSRKANRLRKLDAEDRIEAIAAELGFEVVAPQDLGIEGQIKAFAAARGVAANEGAALTNTIFMPPGARILSMVCENEMMPIWNELSIILGHDHRKLAGKGIPVAGQANRFQPAFAVQPDLARESMLWVLSRTVHCPPEP